MLDGEPHMTTVRAYAHHGPIPDAFLVSAHAETLPERDQPQPVAQYWCELIKQSTVDAPDPGGPGYGKTGAVAPDQWRFDLGYSSGAIDFTVGRVCVLLVGADHNDYDYDLITPQGERIHMPTGSEFSAMAPMPEWGDPAAPYEGLQACWAPDMAVEAAKGIWLIQVFAKSRSEE